MKKIINKIFIFGIVFVSMFWTEEVLAAGISVTASSSSITKGDSVRITATFTSDTNFTLLKDFPSTILCRKHTYKYGETYVPKSIKYEGGHLIWLCM